MKLINALLLGTVVAFGASGIATAADSADPVVGTWILNPAKSKFSNPDRAPTSQTRTYAQSADGTSLTIDTVTAGGSKTTQKSTFKYDGKPYPFTGSPLYDTLTLKQVDAHTVQSVQWKSGKKTGETTRTLSADGKALTVLSKGSDAKGKKYTDEGVYDRQ